MISFQNIYLIKTSGCFNGQNPRRGQGSQMRVYCGNKATLLFCKSIDLKRFKGYFTYFFIHLIEKSCMEIKIKKGFLFVQGLVQGLVQGFSNGEIYHQGKILYFKVGIFFKVIELFNINCNTV